MTLFYKQQSFNQSATVFKLYRHCSVNPLEAILLMSDGKAIYLMDSRKRKVIKKTELQIKITVARTCLC